MEKAEGPPCLHVVAHPFDAMQLLLPRTHPLLAARLP